jgi:hypothetical protein
MKQLHTMIDGLHIPLVAMINQSDYIDVAVLAADIKEDFTIPAKAKKVIFSSNGDFYCQIGSSASAAIAAVDVIDGSGSELNPVARRVVPTETISLIATAACIITMAFYE